MKVEIIPKSKRAKDRVSSHGKIMKLCDEHPTKFLVQSLGQTDKDGTHWLGWFLKWEADYKKVEDK